MTTAPFARRCARRDRGGATGGVRTPREFVVGTIISAISTIILTIALVVVLVQLA
jgi:hypothetical protein